MIFKKIFVLFVSIVFFCFSTSAKDSVTVYIFMLDECRICQELAPALNSIYNTYHPKGIGFVGVFPNFSSKQKGINAFKTKYKITFPTKTDYFKKLTTKFNATVLPEVIFYNETTQTVIYRGLINDLFYSPGKRRHAIQYHYLSDALEAYINNTPLKVAHTTPIGCYINFNDSLTEN